MGKEKIRMNPVFWIKMETVGVNLRVFDTENWEYRCKCVYMHL